MLRICLLVLVITTASCTSMLLEKAGVEPTEENVQRFNVGWMVFSILTGL